MVSEQGIRTNASIRRSVVGLQDRAFSERLQLDPESTLEKANTETVKVQQKLLRELGAS